MPKRHAANGPTDLIERADPFDYASLPASRYHELMTETQAIRKLVVQTATNVIQIGMRLEIVGQLLDCHQYQAWLHAEFAWSVATATRYRQSARVFGNIDCVSRFEPGALYELAARKVPEEARREAIERARNGERVAQKDAREIVKRYKRSLLLSAPKSTRRAVTLAHLIKTLNKLLNARVPALDPQDNSRLADYLGSWSERIRTNARVAAAAGPRATFESAPTDPPPPEKFSQ